MLYYKLRLEIYPGYCHQQLSIRPTSRLTGSDRSPLSEVPTEQIAPPGQTSPGHMPPLEHLPSQANECKTLA